jgi:hypothetical protein
MEGIEQSIASSLEEYPDQAKAWLASRINLEVPRTVFENADLAEWERNITRKVQRALSELQIDWALKLLSERTDRSDASPLFALEAKAYLLADNVSGAADVLTKGITRVSGSTNRGRLAELFWLQAQVEILKHDLKAADDALSQAEKAIEKGSNPIPLMHVLCHRLLLREKFTETYSETVVQLRLKLNNVCARTNDRYAFSAEFVIGLAIYLLGNEFPATTSRLQSLFPYLQVTSVSEDSLTSENLQGLEDYREPWESRDEPSSDVAA